MLSYLQQLYWINHCGFVSSEIIWVSKTQNVRSTLSTGYTTYYYTEYGVLDIYVMMWLRQALLLKLQRPSGIYAGYLLAVLFLIQSSLYLPNTLGSTTTPILWMLCNCGLSSGSYQYLQWMQCIHRIPLDLLRRSMFQFNRQDWSSSMSCYTMGYGIGHSDSRTAATS
jgi:hypothetical protein